MYDIETTISKDVDGNLSFSSNRDGDGDGHDHGQPIYPGYAFTFPGVDSALNYIIQIDNFETGTGFLIPVSGAGDVWTADFSAPVSVSSGLAMPDPNMYSPVGTYSSGAGGGDQSGGDQSGGGDQSQGTPIFTLGANELGIHGPGDYIILFEGAPGSETGYQIQQIVLDNGEYTAVGAPMFGPALQDALDKMSSGSEVGYYMPPSGGEDQSGGDTISLVITVEHLYQSIVFYGADIDPNGDYGLNVNDFYAVDANGNGGGKIIPVTAGSDEYDWTADLSSEIIVGDGSNLVVPTGPGVVPYGTYTPPAVGGEQPGGEHQWWRTIWW